MFTLNFHRKLHITIPSCSCMYLNTSITGFWGFKWQVTKFTGWRNSLAEQYMFNVRMRAICCPSGRLCFLHTYAICLSPIHPSFKNWLRDRLIGLIWMDFEIKCICIILIKASHIESTLLMTSIWALLNIIRRKEKFMRNFGRGLENLETANPPNYTGGHEDKRS